MNKSRSLIKYNRFCIPFTIEWNKWSHFKVNINDGLLQHVRFINFDLMSCKYDDKCAEASANETNFAKRKKEGIYEFFYSWNYCFYFFFLTMEYVQCRKTEWDRVEQQYYEGSCKQKLGSLERSLTLMCQLRSCSWASLALENMLSHRWRWECVQLNLMHLNWEFFTQFSERKAVCLFSRAIEIFFLIRYFLNSPEFFMTSTVFYGKCSR